MCVREWEGERKSKSVGYTRGSPHDVSLYDVVLGANKCVRASSSCMSKLSMQFILE